MKRHRGRQPLPPTTQLGAALRARRGPLSGDVVAAKVGLERGTYYIFERGDSRPGLASAAKLAAWLGWTVGQVVDASERPAE